jgi:hypothetical protein
MARRLILFTWVAALFLSGVTGCHDSTAHPRLKEGAPPGKQLKPVRMAPVGEGAPQKDGRPKGE